MRSANEYKQMHYEALSAQLQEIGEKEDEMRYGDVKWRKYGLEDRVLGILFYVVLL
jgi:hypothetical protein